MKEIKAYIKPHKLTKVTLELHKIEGLTGMSVVDCRGFGRSRGKDAPYRVIQDFVDYVPHVKIEIVCNDIIVDKVVEVIEKTAQTGLRGDGKIFISTIDQAIRIETGETGEIAI